MGEEGVDVVVLGEAVEDDVDFFVLGVGDVDGGLDVVVGEVVGEFAESEDGSADVAGVGAVFEGDFEFFEVAGGGEEFGFFHGGILRGGVFGCNFFLLGTIIRYRAILA